MPIINGVTTKQSDLVWKSPDGQRELYKVSLEYENENFTAKTYSKDIATVGWQGNVLTEERDGRNGSETFVKQPPKEGFAPQQQQSQSSTGQPTSKSTYVPKDEKAIQAMWSIGQSVQAHVSGAMDINDLDSVEAYAKELNSMVDRVKGGNSDPKATSPGEQTAATTTTEVTSEDIDGPIDLSAIDDVFGPTTKENSWKPTNDQVA